MPLGAITVAGKTHIIRDTLHRGAALAEDGFEMEFRYSKSSVDNLKGLAVNQLKIDLLVKEVNELVG
jgi:hypothetical protein